MTTSKSAPETAGDSGEPRYPERTARAAGETRFGYFLSCEEYSPAQLIEQARLAEEAGFDALWISDHFHPWTDAQGESPLVWSIIGAISQVCHLPVTTAVTCPTVRTHPAVIAQAAATSAVLLGENRFRFGVGSGEALNEHILGTVWPHTAVRLEMLEEAIEVIRKLWSGEVISHQGKHYTVDTARIYTLPDTPPPILMSAFGPKAREVAVRAADGFITTTPDGESVREFKQARGTDALTQVGFKVGWADSVDEAVAAAYRIWPNSGVPGELSQVLPSPQHFEQASELVTKEMIAESTSFGNDPATHLRAYQPFVDAGFDEIYVANMGPHYADMIKEFGSEVLPELRRG
ncbi:TIGR03557 family F420-dependent LLM class oxidoreductase [Nakamurella aerolata]|uniref:TIGR03557 family F420-dependent LLM class oxidoreductase n=1 Tax=Nakamurella aerolata TaxID=1656892 RepID=A0A849A9I4_9ACTN|nr:TIGR03557 family F420-dependent LLM class oxidoreductase [Nakamurella aerolata]NNG37199.1 TIGR03557 family F420-dependent LLM class oxidoreductase [Nakamurella aerolata]